MLQSFTKSFNIRGFSIRKIEAGRQYVEHRKIPFLLLSSSLLTIKR